MDRPRALSPKHRDLIPWTEEDEQSASYEAALRDGDHAFSLAEDWFSPQHVERFRRAGISPEFAFRAGIVSVENEAALSSVGFSDGQIAQLSLPGLLIPWPPTLTTRRPRYHQYRPDHPISPKRKYEVPFRTRLTLYLLPGWADASRPLFVAEAAFKALPFAVRGLPALGFQGCYGWCKKDKAGKLRLNPAWDRIPLAGRAVPIAADSNVVTKPYVYQAYGRLYELLLKRGARVTVIPTPEGFNGIDDWFGAGHTIQEFLALAPLDFDHPHPASPEYQKDLRDTRRHTAVKEQVQVERSPIPEVQPQDWTEMLAGRNVRELIEGTGIIGGGIVTFFGHTGSFKSLMLQDLAWHLASTGRWQHRNRVGGRRTTYYIALEGASGIASRAQAWRLFWEGQRPPGQRWRLDSEIGDLAHPEYRKRLINKLVEVGADLLFIDSYGLAMTKFKGGLGNENTDANGFVLALREVAAEVSARTGRPLTTFLIHHEGLETGRPRGASALAQACDIVLEVKRAKGTSNVSYVTAYKPSRDLDHLFRPWTIRTAAQRWGAEPEQASFIATIDDTPPPAEALEEKTKRQEEWDKVHEEVFRAVSGTWERTKEIEERLPFAPSTVRRHLNKLAKEKRVTRKTVSDPSTRKDADTWKKR